MLYIFAFGLELHIITLSLNSLKVHQPLLLLPMILLLPNLLNLLNSLLGLFNLQIFFKHQELLLDLLLSIMRYLFYDFQSVGGCYYFVYVWSLGASSSRSTLHSLRINGCLICHAYASIDTLIVTSAISHSGFQQNPFIVYLTVI